MLGQLFKQPRSLSKGRCLHRSESCLFSSGRCFPLQAPSSNGPRNSGPGKRTSKVAKHTAATCWPSGVCACNAAVAELSESSDNWSQMLVTNQTPVAVVRKAQRGQRQPAAVRLTAKMCASSEKQLNLAVGNSSSSQLQRN